MGQEVNNLLRAQSKYGLMGSSAKTEKKFFEGHRSTFSIKVPFGIGHTPTYTSNAVYMCAGGFKGPKSSNRIQLSRFVQMLWHFSDFVVPTWSPWSPRCPHHPHVIPIVPMSSPSSPCHPHSPQKVPMWSPHCPRHPHVVPVVLTSSPYHLEGPHIIPNPPPIAPRRSPCGPHIVPVIPMLSLLSSHHPHII